MSTGTSHFATPDQPSDPGATIDKPTGLSLRIQPLDVLRAIAVLGGLLVSIWMFGGFSNNKQLQLLLNPQGKNYMLYSFIVLFFEGKMLALICLVFGAGMILYLTKPNKRTKLPVADAFIRRQLWLLGFGLLNALLFLWSGDILFHLAIMGILLFPFFRLSSKGLLIASLVAVAIFCGKNYWKYADDKTAYSKFVAVTALEKKFKQDSIARAKKGVAGKDKKALASNAAKKDTLTKQQKADKGAWEGILASKKYDPKKDDGENKEMRALSFGKLWDHLLPTTQSREAQWTYQTGVWDMAGFILLGMALLKLGFFSNRLSRSKYAGLAVGGLVAGLLLAYYRLHYNHVSVIDYTKYIRKYWLPYNFFFPLEKVFMTVGYASVVMLLIKIIRLASIWSAIASVGRMALTNYLLQSIICMLFFTGYGMGYFGRLEQYQLYLVAVEIWILQIVFSVLWLRSFKYGPAEWLWRCMTYGKWLPIKKNTPDIDVEPIIPALS